MGDAVDTLYYSNDAIFCIVNLFPTNIQVDEPYFYLTLNECLTLLFTLVGIIVAISQFKKQMAKNREEQRLMNVRNWFLSVIVLPQIESMNLFYLKLVEDILSDIGILRSSKSGDLVLLSEKQAVRKEQVNIFFDHLQSLIRSFDIPLSRKIAIEVEKLEDEVTIILGDCLGRRLYTNNEIRRRLLLNKGEIISILYGKILEDDNITISRL